MEIVVGDRVRLIHGTEEGIVIRIIDEKLIEVAIDNDFAIPVLAKEVAKIAREERFLRPEIEQPKKVIASNNSNEAVKAKLLATKGVFLGLVRFGNNDCDIFLLNNTEITYLYTFHEVPIRNQLRNELKGVKCGQITPNNYEKIKTIAGYKPEIQPKWHFELLAFNTAHYIHPHPIITTINIQEYSPQKAVFVQALKSEAILIQLDAIIQPQVDTNALKKSLMGDSLLINTTPKNLVKQFQKPPKTIDLHADALLLQHLGPNDILPQQLKVFQERLTEAIVHKIPKITFIHGVGNGVLRSEIQKILSKHPHINTFKDAQKERFGYGAIEVIIE